MPQKSQSLKLRRMALLVPAAVAATLVAVAGPAAAAETSTGTGTHHRVSHENEVNSTAGDPPKQQTS
ncbi:hypothetical protein CTZ27_03995 [Streptomyces griseocarneus]|nr:hypothetical protein CTZ27_03995 [Streptomyces griseocarneus]